MSLQALPDDKVWRNMTAEAPDEFKVLFEKRSDQINFAMGKVVVGRIVSVLRDYVVVNIGFKSEGYIDIEEFRDLDGEVTVQSGDTTQVVIEEVEDEHGSLVLSKERADAIQAWDRMEGLFNDNGVVEGLVVNKVKGGLSVNLGGIRAFLPGSQLDLKPAKSLDKFIGKKFGFKILKLNKEKGNIVLSRRVLLEEERENMKRDILNNIREGMVIRGTVKNLTEYGAFVDLGGIDGLLHVTDMTWGRVAHPGDVVKVNEEIDVAVLKYDAEKEKISLGLKQLQEDPWEKQADKFKPGDRIKGRVVSLADYGAFIEVVPGIEGLVHVSEISWSKKIKHPNKLLKVGDTVDAMVLDVDKAGRKMALGLKQLEPNPWEILHQKYPVGSKLTGKVRNITDFGIFVGVGDDDVDGLVHVSDISWEKGFKWPNDDYKKGQDIAVIVLNIDAGNKKFSLGVKQLSDNPFALMMRTHPLGSEVTGRIEEVNERGIVFRIDEKTLGFVPASETGVPKSKVKEHFSAGSEVSAQVKKYDDRDRCMIASIKALEKRQEKESMKEFLSKQGTATVTLQDIMK